MTNIDRFAVVYKTIKGKGRARVETFATIAEVEQWITDNSRFYRVIKVNELPH